MSTLDEAIARCRSQLRFIPTRALRAARVVALLSEVTQSDEIWADLLDGLGSYLGGAMWPPPSPWKLARMHEVGPAFITLMPNCDLRLSYWDREPSVTFAMPAKLVHDSLLYRFVMQPFKEFHLAIYGYPERANGDQVVILFTREENGPPYSDGDLRSADLVCAAFADELLVLEPARVFMPRHPSAAEHVFTLDTDFRPLGPSLYAQALLALFYGGHREAVDGSPRLPATLEADLRAHHDTHQRLGDIAPGDYGYAFSKNYMGRVLLVNLRATPNSGYQLTVHEDLAQHARLHRLKAACRRLTRDRTNVYVTCLLLAEGVRDPAEIARRGGFPNHKPSSALKIINQARRIVAEA
jgi:hypothetical protein